jgi:hypothetical protein
MVAFPFTTRSTTMNANMLIAKLVGDYETLQQTNGAGAYLDESQTYTAGQWLGGGMAGTIEQAKAHLRAVAETFGKHEPSQSESTVRAIAAEILDAPKYIPIEKRREWAVKLSRAFDQWPSAHEYPGVSLTREENQGK